MRLFAASLLICSIVSASEYVYSFNKVGVPVTRIDKESGKVEHWSDLQKISHVTHLNSIHLASVKKTFAQDNENKSAALRDMALDVAQRYYPEFDKENFAQIITRIGADKTKVIDFKYYNVEKGEFHWLEFNEMKVLEKKYHNEKDPK